MGLFALSRSQEVGASLFVFLDPLLSEAAIDDLGENLLHFLACFGGDDPLASGVVALFGGVAHGIAHVAETPLIDEIDDKLQLVEALEISHLRLISGVYEGLPASLDQFTDAAAEDRLLAEQVGFGFFSECRFEDAGARATESFCIRE